MTTLALPSQPFLLLLPDEYDGSAVPLIIYHGGTGETMSAPRTDTLKQTLITYLLSNGYAIVASNAHGNNWGNDASLADFVELHTWAKSQITPSVTLLLSQSMGGMSGLLTAAARPFAIAGWAGIYPVCNLADCYTNPTFETQINTAYNIPGGGTYAEQTAGHDPVLLSASAFAGLRMRFYASASDTIVSKTNNSDAMATLVDATATENDVVVCSGDHGDTSHFQPADLIAFFNRCWPGNGYYGIDVATNDYINFASGATLDNLASGAFTAEAWIRPHTLGESNIGHIFSKGAGATTGWNFYLGATGLTAQVYYTPTFAWTATSGSSLVGSWHHVAMTFDAAGDKKVNIFVDGVERSYSTDQAATSTIAADAAASLLVGTFNTGTEYSFDGDIGWIRVSNNVRYTGTFTPVSRKSPPSTDANTLLLARLTEGTGTSIADSSGNGNNGTLTAGTWVAIH